MGAREDGEYREGGQWLRVLVDCFVHLLVSHLERRDPVTLERSTKDREADGLAVEVPVSQNLLGAL